MHQSTTIYLQPARPSRVMLAFAVSPLAGAAFGSLLMGPMAFCIFAPIAYSIAVIFGIPAYLILKALKWLNIWIFMLAGYAISVSGLNFFMLSISNIYTADDWLALLFAPYHLITLFGTLVFWCLAVTQTETGSLDQPLACEKSPVDPC